MNSIHFTFLFFINILTFVTSSPIHIISDQSKSFNPPTPSSSNGISILSNDEIPDLTRFVTYSAASYCSNSADWTCGTYCEQIPDTTEIVVTFRGTANTGNTVKDYEVVQCSYGFGSTTVPIISKPVGALVHFGFYTAFLTFQQELRKVISESIKQYPDYKLVVTGHSLGGALASFAALDLKQSGANPCLYTYGEPRIGNTVFASFMYKTLDTMRRVVNQADEVPHLIPRVDYIHHQGEIWIANTTANQAVKCSGEENKLCSDSVPSKDWNNVDHDGPYWGLLIATSS
ncbi:22636_t:CDS:2, partial [Gigaspora rosea]